MTDVVKDVRVNSGGAAEDTYTQHFETRKWIGILMALACLIPSNPNIVPGPDHHEIICRGLYLVLNLFYELSREEFSSSNLNELERKTIPEALNAAYGIFMVRQKLKASTKHFRGVKLHVILHFPALIRRFGNPLIWDTDTYESAHKEKVKLLFKLGSKRISNVEQEALARVRCFHCCNNSP